MAELENREELAELEIGEDCFDMMLYIEHWSEIKPFENMEM